MLRLTDHQRSGTLDRLRTEGDVVALVLLCHCHRTTSIRLRKWFPKSWYVKFRPRAGQPNVTTSSLDGSLLLLIAAILQGLPLSPPYVSLISENKFLSKLTYKYLYKSINNFFHRENLIFIERRSRKACTVANGRYTCSLICEFTYLGITLLDLLSLPIFYSSLWN